MIQSGDPLTKDDSKADMWGTGGPGYKFALMKFMLIIEMMLGLFLWQMQGRIQMEVSFYKC